MVLAAAAGIAYAAVGRHPIVKGLCMAGGFALVTAAAAGVF